MSQFRPDKIILIAGPLGNSSQGNSLTISLGQASLLGKDMQEGEEKERKHRSCAYNLCTERGCDLLCIHR